MLKKNIYGNSKDLFSFSLFSSVYVTWHAVPTINNIWKKKERNAKEIIDWISIWSFLNVQKTSLVYLLALYVMLFCYVMYICPVLLDNCRFIFVVTEWWMVGLCVNATINIDRDKASVWVWILTSLRTEVMTRPCYCVFFFSVRLQVKMVKALYMIIIVLSIIPFFSDSNQLLSCMNCHEIWWMMIASQMSEPLSHVLWITACTGNRLCTADTHGTWTMHPNDLIH